MRLAVAPVPPAVPAGRRDAVDPVRSPAASPVPARRGECEVVLELRHAGRRRVALRHALLGGGDGPVVLVAGGIFAGRHVARSAADPGPGWWDAQVGPGRAIDPQARRVLAFDWLGADGTLDAVIDPADQADAVAALLDGLGIARLEAFVGSSYGAMVGLQFAARHGHRLGQLVAISGTHRAHPYCSARRASQHQALALAALQCDGPHGLSPARQPVMPGDRTPEEFARRSGPATVEHDRVRVAAGDDPAHCGRRYGATATAAATATTVTAAATAFLRLSESLDLQHLDPARIHLPVTVVAVAGDRLVPLEDAYALAEGLAGPARLRVLRSPFGHDAFLKETTAIDAVLREALGAAREPAA